MLNEWNQHRGEDMTMQTSRTRTPVLHATAALLLGLVATVPARAQDAPVLIDASICMRFETSVERLVCFEEQAKAAAGTSTGSQSNLPVLRIDRSAPAATTERAAPAPAAPAPPAAATGGAQPAAPVASNPADPDADFGLPESRDERDKRNNRELFGTIESIRELSPNRYLITLTNGQVWRQMRADHYNLRAGHKVRIYPTRWGSSYRLTVEELKGFIQVERIR